LRGGLRADFTLPRQEIVRAPLQPPTRRRRLGCWRMLGVWRTLSFEHACGVTEAMDRLSRTQRSELMRRVPSKNTKPELMVRRLLRSLGYRFRLHVHDLPGRPDFVFPTLKKVIFVHGCFWHRHTGCKKASTPKSNVYFWRRKFRRNKARDQAGLHELQRKKWAALVVWECQIRPIEELGERILRFLGPKKMRTRVRRSQWAE
jgi:DNA mismatch endonuclease (patch repair protein)